ncbi:MAG TPA: sensor histidine kinase [Chloroflexota bacterium]|nr:sensor histidine kinase [Chloroflexota bacterium]
MLGTGLAAAASLSASTYSYVALILAPGSLPLGIWAAWAFSWLIWIVLAALPMTLLLFPTGRLPSGRWWTLACVLIGCAALLCLLAMLAPGSIRLAPRSPALGPNPIGVTALAGPIKALYAPVDGLYLLAVVGCALAPIWRWRKGRGDERQQLKVLAYVATWVVVVMVLSYLPPVQRERPVADALWALTMLGLMVGLPVAVAVAILRYRLYDFDAVISKTIVYAGLAFFITAAYVLLVVGVGTLIGAATQANLLLSVLATAVVAIAFQPVRLRVQALADRLVFGRRTNPNTVLSHISQMVAASASTEQVLSRLLELAGAATGAAASAVYMEAGSQRHLAARWPAGGEDVGGHSVPITYQGKGLGELVIQRAETPTPAEERLLADVAAQAGLLVRNLRLTADLEARVEELAESRRRIVAAQDAERRRLERDIHDGVQQQVVALMAKLRLARNQVNRQSALAAGTLDEVQADAGRLLDDLRELASGIHPVVLTDGGIIAALRSRADHLPLQVVIEADPEVRQRRYPEAVEAAGYFIACEALANVLKHAGAARATVGIRAEDHCLALSVRDDGRGFDLSAVKPSGLRGLEDRAAALGGRLEVSSCPGSGTTVTALLPTNA